MGAGYDNVTLRQLIADRYKGGNYDEFRVAQGPYSEARWMMSSALTALYRRWASGQNVDSPGSFYFEGSPSDYSCLPPPQSCEPTHQEMTDFQFMFSRTSKVYDSIVASGSNSPHAPELLPFKVPYKYRALLDNRGKVKYYQNSKYKEGGPWYDPGPPAYPPVFGPDPSATPAEPPPVEPPPVEPPPVKPEEPKPEPPVCPVLSDEEILRRAGEVLRRMFPPPVANVGNFPGLPAHPADYGAGELPGGFAGETGSSSASQAARISAMVGRRMG
ncbi:MAG TPA: hypothetical protein VLT87_10890 [Thermoanaerobaculia bacterium]|nr:hypothetical protein [Thermoanaerobaculia bacterium]